MTNNDILRQLRYIFDLNDKQMVGVFAAAEFETTPEKVGYFLQKDEETQLPLKNKELNAFLDGLINQKRGKREGYKLVLNDELSNNMILRKLKIAQNYKDTDLLAIFKLADVSIGKHELSAFFRNPKQNQYRDMGNQYLRNFLFGLQKQLRPSEKEEK